jgi:hypothetical protein
MTGQEQPEVVEMADTAYEAIRRINHITGGPMLAPRVYAVLGNLKMVGYGLQQALRQIGDGLVASLELDKYAVYEDDGRDPVVSVLTAQEYMEAAAEAAEQVGRCLDWAQSAISRQGYEVIEP